MHFTDTPVAWRPRASPETKFSRVNPQTRNATEPRALRVFAPFARFVRLYRCRPIFCQGHLMDTENDSEDSENPNWAYPMLQMVISGAFVEIIATTICGCSQGLDLCRHLSSRLSISSVPVRLSPAPARSAVFFCIYGFALSSPKIPIGRRANGCCLPASESRRLAIRVPPKASSRIHTPQLLPISWENEE